MGLWGTSVSLWKIFLVDKCKAMNLILFIEAVSSVLNALHILLKKWLR